jgi:hypothetical protein
VWKITFVCSEHRCKSKEERAALDLRIKGYDPSTESAQLDDILMMNSGFDASHCGYTRYINRHIYVNQSGGGYALRHEISHVLTFLLGLKNSEPEANLVMAFLNDYHDQIDKVRAFRDIAC